MLYLVFQPIGGKNRPVCFMYSKYSSPNWSISNVSSILVIQWNGIDKKIANKMSNRLAEISETDREKRMKTAYIG
jgi:hypothetical protein